MSVCSVIKYKLWKQSITACLEGRAMLWVPGYRPTVAGYRAKRSA